MAYDFAGRDVGATPGIDDYIKNWLVKQQGYYESGPGMLMSNAMGIDMNTGGATMPMFLETEGLGKQFMSLMEVFPGLREGIEQYMNTYYAGAPGEKTAAEEVAGLGVTLPQSYVSRDPVKGDWKEGPVDMLTGGQSMTLDPTGDHVYDPVAYYKGERGSALGLTDWEQSDWEAYMGDKDRPGAGVWRVNPQGQLTWVASSPTKNDPNAHTWFQNAVGPTLANLITTIVPTALGGYIGGPTGAAAGNFLGQLLTPGINERGGPNFMQMGLAALSPYVGEGLSEAADWAGGALSGLSQEALTEGGMATAEGVAGSAEELFANSGVLSGVVEEAPGVMAEITPTVDLGRDITGIEMGMVPESPMGPGISDITMEATGSLSGVDPTQAVVDFITNPENWRTAGQVLEAGLSIAQGIQGASPEFGPLPELLALGSPPPELPELDTTLPAGPSWEFPKMDYAYPEGWDSWTDAERQAWLIQRGGEASKRHRATFAGDLRSMRGGTDLLFGELKGSYPGAQLLGG